MDYLIEAKKFVQRAFDAGNPDVIKEHLKIADWCLCQEIEERDDAFSRGTHKKAERSSNPSWIAEQYSDQRLAPPTIAVFKS